MEFSDDLACKGTNRQKNNLETKGCFLEIILKFLVRSAPSLFVPSSKDIV